MSTTSADAMTQLAAIRREIQAARAMSRSPGIFAALEKALLVVTLAEGLIRERDDVARELDDLRLAMEESATCAREAD